jgi:hypothetical protein
MNFLSWSPLFGQDSSADVIADLAREAGSTAKLISWCVHRLLTFLFRNSSSRGFDKQENI